MFGFNAFSEFPFSDILFGEVPPDPSQDKHDGWTKKERKKWKEIQAKLALAEQQKQQAKIERKEARKQFIRELVSPVAKKQQPKVELPLEVQDGTPPIDLAKVNEQIARLEQKQKQLLEAIELRKQIAEKQMQLAILEAKAKAQEEDDEATILALLFQTPI